MKKQIEKNDKKEIKKTKTQERSSNNMTIEKNTNVTSKFLHYFSFLLFFMICIISIFIYMHHDAIIKEENNLKKITKKTTNEINNLKNELQNKKEIVSSSTNDQTNRANLNLNQQPNDDFEFDFKPTNSNKFLSFDKLIGFKEELTACEGFLGYLKNKSDYEGIGDVEAPLGILMYGCPGTGKTTLARALAKETNLPFFEVSSSMFSQKYKGDAPQMVQDLFDSARETAEKSSGAIIFLDECETIFTDLSTLEAGVELANVVNQFKTEMTSLDNNPKKPIFIIGATNHVEQIDEAIKSRFTYNIEVKPGNKDERKKMLEFLINKRKNPYSDEAKDYLFNVINESLEQLPQEKEFLKANRTLENLLKTTVNIFARNRRTGENKRQTINKDDLKQAYKMIISTNTNILDQIETTKKP